MKALGKLLCIAAVLNLASATARSETMEVAFWNKAPKLIEQFRDSNYKNVGVLKFHVQKSPDGKLSHTTGPLNYNAARRLETALIFALAKEQDRDAKPVMIVRDATKTAGSIPKADHLGYPWQRERLFAPVYSASWGEQKLVFPDAFVTGKLTMHDDLAKMTVHLEIFDKKNPSQARPLADFDVDVRADTLIETGHSFRSFNPDEIEKLTGGVALTKDPTIKIDPTVKKDPVTGNPAVKPDPTVKVDPSVKKDPVTGNPAVKPIVTNPITPASVNANAVVQPGGTAAPLAVEPKDDVLKNAPVELTVFFDNKPVPVTFANGEHMIPAPQPGQKVIFGMQRKDNATDAKYGVVLLLNGMCTLGMERKPPSECQRWVFEKNDPAGFVGGFFKGDKTINSFSVVPPSQELQTEYKDNLGTISFTIFKEGLAAPKDPNIPLKDQVAEAEITKRIIQGANLQVPVAKDPVEPPVKKDPVEPPVKKDPVAVPVKKDPVQAKPEIVDESQFPTDLPRSLTSLRQQLEELAAEPLRNAIIPGEVTSVDPLRTTTFINPGVQMTVTIRYFEAN